MKKNALIISAVVIAAVATGFVASHIYSQPQEDQKIVDEKPDEPYALSTHEEAGSLMSDWQNMILTQAPKRFKDPQSVVIEFNSAVPAPCHIRDMNPIPWLEYLGYCGLVNINAKNSFGGYVGAEPYFFSIHNNELIFMETVKETEKTIGVNDISIKIYKIKWLNEQQPERAMQVDGLHENEKKDSEKAEDKTIATMFPSPEWQPIEGAPDWRLKAEELLMGDAKNVTVALLSPIIHNQEPSLHKYPAVMEMRCELNKTELAVFFSTMLQSTIDDEVEIEYKIDDGKITKAKWIRSTNFMGIFAPKPIAYTREILTAKRVIFRLKTRMGATTETYFDLEGIQAAVAPIQAACGWK
jgi:hypothetical protein